MATYVQGHKTDTWHFCRNCSNYPMRINKRRSTKPTTGELCDQCRGKDRRGDCKK